MVCLTAEKTFMTTKVRFELRSFNFAALLVGLPASPVRPEEMRDSRPMGSPERSA